MSNEEALNRVNIVEYDPRWPRWFELERDFLVRSLDRPFRAIEHIGSTAIIGLKAKPIIDMMASFCTLPSEEAVKAVLHPWNYRFIPNGMQARFLFRKRPSGDIPMFHLHLVSHDTWSGRKERLMRDYLREHPEAAERYGAVKQRLARDHEADSMAYTRAKTSFIQDLMDEACDERGIARFDVWTDR